MSNIQQNLANILSSRYGRDVRQSIHDGIQTCYTETKFVPRGAYSSMATYSFPDMVTYGGGSYLYIYPTPEAGVPVINTSHWQQIASKGQMGPIPVYNDLAALTAADPDHQFVYIAKSTGKWYHYDDDDGWVEGGDFTDTDQTTAINAQLAQKANKTKQDNTSYDVKVDFGAIGDGASHPLSEKYATLTDAQADYPFATALTQQIDWCAFTAMFRQANTTKKGCYIPDGDYYILDPIEPIGSDSGTSTEFGNFKIKGESMNYTVLIFQLTDDAQVGLQTVAGSAGWDISNFRVKNIGAGASGAKKGIGIYLNSIYKSTVKNIQSIYFGIAIKSSTYVTNLTNLNGTYSACGFYVENGTSTTFINCWGAGNTLYAGDVRDFAGCGYFISTIQYSKFVACAADSNKFAYKIKSGTTYQGFVSAILEFDTCGCEVNEEAWNIDAPGFNVVIKNPSLYEITNKKVVHVENAYQVLIEDYADQRYQNFTTGINVGLGVVRFVDGGFNTGGNPSFFPNPKTANMSVYGMGDFVYDGISINGTEPFANGKLLMKGNNLEFEIYARGNGATCAAKVEIMPVENNSGTTMDRGGNIYIGAINSADYIVTNETKSNASYGLTVTKILDGAKHIGLRVLIEPFTGMTGATSSKAFFKVDTYFSPMGTDWQGKNHNVKLPGTYTGRVNCRLKGVDY